MRKVAVIGGGIFGLYSAVELLKTGYSVDIYEQGEYLGQGASKVNQARLHLGYHYPRSPETVIQSINGFYGFKERFSTAINNNFKQYYAIASDNSKTTPDEYIRFCNNFNLPYKIVNLDSDIINDKYIDLCIEVPEVGSVEYNDPRVLPQFPCDLAVSDIDGVHFACAVAEQTVGEPACGRADVDSHRSFESRLEMADRGFQFCAAPACVRLEFAPNLYPRVGRHLCTRFVNQTIVDGDATGENQTSSDFA